MADTQRTKTDLLTNLFQEGQQPDSISPQDIRDLILSLSSSTAAGRFTSAATIEPLEIGTMTSPSSGTSDLVINTDDITMPQDGRMQYIGTVPRNFIITLSITATVTGNNQDLRFQLTKNSLPIVDTITGRTWATGSDEGNLTIVTGITLNTNDYLELQVANDSSTGIITIVNGALTMHGSI